MMIKIAAKELKTVERMSKENILTDIITIKEALNNKDYEDAKQMIEELEQNIKAGLEWGKLGVDLQ